MTARPRVVVVDYGIGNLHSASKALELAGAEVIVSGDGRTIDDADSLVLPGVGAMGRCMESLDEHQLRSAITDFAMSGRPFLGICVGMQMLHDGSEENGGVAGLGLIPGIVRKLTGPVKLPQMQWNVVSPIRSDASALLGSMQDPWMYFVHSFAPELHEHVVATCDYGGPVGVIVERGSVMGTQFHPEKSSASGIALLSNFVLLAVSDRVRP